VLCTLEFAPGTWTTAAVGTPIRAAFTIARGRLVVASATVLVRGTDGTARVHAARLAPGRYVLTVTTGRGRSIRALLRRTVTVR